MNVRYACTADVSRLVELARNEHAQSVWAELPFDADYTAGFVRMLIETFSATVLLSERGYIAGMVQPSGFSRGLMAVEYAFYAEDGHGMLLLDSFEQWAARMGARNVVVHDYATGDDRLARVLTRRRHYRRLGAALSKQVH